jgi:hypothetical protein
MPLVAKTLRMGIRIGGKRPNLSESRLRHHSSPIFNSLVFFPQHRFHRFVRQQLGQWFGGLVQHRSRLDGRFN